MKKHLLFTFCLLISGIAAQASHLMGGQITSRNIGGLTYEVTLTLYRDMLGISVNPSYEINYSDTSGVNLTVIAANLGPIVFGNGVEKYIYTGIINFPASGTYDVWFENCCRNAAILNIPNPDSFHLANKLLVDSTNSSPEFLNDPITVAQLGVPFTYNPLPFDVDGDSIAWMLDIPQEGITAVSTPAPGYVLPSSDTLVPFNMDPVTGEITFLPNIAGNFVVSMLVNEYRAGVKIGEIRRDMQIIVVPSVNTPSPITLISTNAPYSGKNYTIEPGTAFNFTVVANDPDGYAINFSSNSEAFRLSNPATFTSNATLGMATASLSWTPNSSNERSRPYIIGLRLNEPYGIYNFVSDISIYLRVQTATGINNPANADVKFNIYPNPTSDYMMLNFSSKSNSNARIEIRNVAGQLMKTYDAVKVVNGLNVIQVKDLNLNAGIYIVNVIQDGKTLGISKVNIR